MIAEWNPFSDDSFYMGHHSFLVLLCKLLSFHLCALELHFVCFLCLFWFIFSCFQPVGKGGSCMVLLFSCIWFSICSFSLLPLHPTPLDNRQECLPGGVLILFSTTHLSALPISLCVFSFIFSVSPQPKSLFVSPHFFLEAPSPLPPSSEPWPY